VRAGKRRLFGAWWALSLWLALTASAPAQTDGVVERASPAPVAGPLPASATTARTDVQAAVDALARWAQDHGGTLGAAVLHTGSAELWAQSNADVALNPASNAKVVTSAAALSRLGPSFRFATGLYGVIEGERVATLVLRSNGDPSLGMADLWQLAAGLKQRGVRKVERILVDQSRFDARFVPPAFEQQPDEWAAFRAPISAVALERNAVTLVVVPTRAGAPARTWIEPPGVLELTGSVQTRAPGSGQNVSLSLAPREGALGATLGGQVAQGLPELRFARRLDDPRRAPGLALAAALNMLGVSAPKQVGLGGESVLDVLALHPSPPLASLVPELGKNSDNFYAEMLLVALAAEQGKLPASSEDGAAVVRAWLARIGAWSDDARFTNGSGLFDADRLSARSLVKVLAHASRDPRIASEFVAQLAIGGVDGTLKGRFSEFAPTRSVRAKTGTLAQVNCLSGYVLPADGSPPVAFALLVNGVAGNGGEIRKQMDDIVRRVARAVTGRPAAPAPRAAAR
jgi:serine-type D-Ala-D-Ala carboxypeptidase/endopeptidase (penicillin-binding protein 4)